MKKSVSLAALFVAFPISSAMAADLPSKKELVTAPVASPMWTGFHIGLNAGGAWGNNSALNGQTWNVWTPPSPSEPISQSLLSGSVSSAGSLGFIGGGQVGYDWQVPVSRYSFVTGIEADIQGVAGAGGNRGRVLAGAGQENGGAVNVVSYQQGSSNLSYLGTVRGRVGFLATPSLLLYGTAGLAYGGMSASIQNTQRMYWQFDNSSGAVFGQGSYSKTMVGWTAGGGVEWMFMPNWSAKAEYLYYDLGRASGSVVNNYFEPGNNGVESVTNYAGRVSGNIVRAGVNYHMNFASAPVIAKF